MENPPSKVLILSAAVSKLVIPMRQSAQQLYVARVQAEAVPRNQLKTTRNVSRMDANDTFATVKFCPPVKENKSDPMHPSRWNEKSRCFTKNCERRLVTLSLFSFVKVSGRESTLLNEVQFFTHQSRFSVTVEL